MRLWGPLLVVVVAAGCGSFASAPDGTHSDSGAPHAPAAPGFGSGGVAGDGASEDVPSAGTSGEAGAQADADSDVGDDGADPDADAAPESEASSDGGLDATLGADAAPVACVGDAGQSEGGACHFYAAFYGPPNPCFATFDEACACLGCPTSQCHLKGGRLKIDFCLLKKKGEDGGCDASAPAPSTVACTDAGTSDAADLGDAPLD